MTADDRTAPAQDDNRAGATADGGRTTRADRRADATASVRWPRVKVCGITRERDLLAAASAGADAVGLIAEVDVDTPREVPVERAADFARAAPVFVAPVLVTMAASVERLVTLVERVEPAAVQVHGDLSPAGVEALGERVAADVVRAADAGSPDRLRAHDGAADALLVDSLTTEGAGGTGEAHDWDRTADVVADLESPTILAGGLTPDNVARAIRRVRPYGVDVASGVEREGGVKDHAAVAAFVERAKRGAPEGIDGD